MIKKTTMKHLEFSKRNMFDTSMILTYDMVCEQGATYEEFMEAMGKMRDGNKNSIEEVVGEPLPIPSYKLRDGREIQFVLRKTEHEDNNMRWVIEWYEGEWAETEPAEKKKKGFIHREVFYDDMAYTLRLRELDMDDDHSPIIVGTYMCKIVDKNPQRVLM